ncbi:MAG: metal-sensitive transcriptional regulator [Deltaproteobacteria bacterium]|nr:metal-sensitive transcriptional regulator [Deltaproteobacteria bacterium]
MKHANHSDQVGRLRRIEGQVKGILRMVEGQRYCMDILTQLRAAKAALGKVEEQVLREHVEHCVVQAVQGDDPMERQAKIDELLDVVSRFSAR